ncbi:MAG: M15 family metallopeptidase [Bacteriovoracaceae bacterium]|nr:M15 family metallopeptidase [Bacteriovoracaceae bacterium]
MQPNHKILFGKSQEHLTCVPGTKYLIHNEALASFVQLKESAKAQGFDLCIASSFRSFLQQLDIWTAKAQGIRPLLDSTGTPLNYSTLTKTEILFAILRWSAIPGFSRHHWGTDIDIYDKNALPTPAYQVELTPEEVDTGGIFSPLHNWLDELIQDGNCFGFYRPYRTPDHGVAPERWHLSFAPVSLPYSKLLNPQIFKLSIQASSLTLKEQLIEHSDEIFQKYILTPGP